VRDFILKGQAELNEGGYQGYPWLIVRPA